MIKTKKILIALAVIGANVLHNMPVYTALAEADYTITCGGETVNSSGDSGSTYTDVVGNTSLTGSPLSGIDMVVRRGTYNEASMYGWSIKMVASSADGVNINNNNLTIDGGTFNNWVYGVDYDGGYGSVATFENNHITLNDGNYKIVYGVYANYGQATENMITINGGTFIYFSNYEIYAGKIQSSGNAISNQVIINGGTFKKGRSIYGGYVGSGNVVGNTVTINNGTFSDTDGWINIFGGYGDGGSSNDNGNVTKNMVNVNGGTYGIACSFYGGYLGGSSQYGSISENEVNVSGGTFNAKMSFYGGSLPRNDLNAVSIEKNKVTVKNVTLANGSEIYGGYSNKVKIDSNNVTIDSGIFDNVVIVGGKSETAGVFNNSVTLNGGNFTNGTKIVAGIGVNDSDKFSGNSISLAGSNTLDLSGASLMGFDGTGFANSTLNVGRTNVAVKDIQNFGTIAFDLSGVSSDAVVLKMGSTGTAYNLSNLGSVAIGVSGLTLADGDFITLLNNVSGDITNITVSTSGGHVKVLGNDLIYYTGTEPTAPKGDFEITTNGTKSATGNKYYNDGSGTTDTIDSTSKTYNYEIKGNINFADGTVTTNYIGNTVLVRRGAYENTIYGVKYDGDVQTTGISGNKVTIRDGSFKSVYTAYAKNGQVTGNTLTIEDGMFATGSTLPIYAGYVEENGKVEGNKIFINGGDVGSAKDAVAGYIGGIGDAIGNEITITGGKIGADDTNFNIYGAELNKGSATGNKVNIGGGEVGKWVHIYGALLSGVSSAGDANTYIGRNEVNISGGSFGYVQYIAGGYASMYEAELVENNKVNIKNVTIEGKSSSNKTTIYGGYATNDNTTVKGNSVIVEDATFENVEIYGGWTSTKNAEGNIVTIKSGGFGEWSEIYGGRTSTGKVTGNQVTITRGTFGDNTKIVGGCTDGTGSVSGNIVTVDSGTFGASNTIYGGHSIGSGASVEDVKGNVVNINDGNLRGNIYGGRSEYGNAKNNIVNIYGGNFVAYSTINAGQAGGNLSSPSSACADRNIMNILGGTFADNCSFYGGYSSGTSSDNTLNLETKMSGTALMVGFFQTLNFTLPRGIADGNVMLSTDKLQVNVGSCPDNGTATINVYAADGVELFENNVITLISATQPISGNFTVDKIFGEEAEQGGTSGNEFATDMATVVVNANTIVLTMNNDYFFSESWYGTTAGGSTRKKSEAVAVGGQLIIDATDSSFAKTKYFYGGYSNGNDVEVKDNIVTVNNGTFGSEMEIFGGYSKNGPANNNIVNINRGTFNDGYKLYGGLGTSSSNNTLNLNIKMGGKAKSVSHFQTMNFVLPSDTANGQTMLSTETLKFDDTKTIINVDASGTTLNNGDIITLIASDSAPMGVWQAGNITGAEGAISLSNNKLLFTIGGSSDVSEDQQKAPVEGVATAAVIVNASADLASGEGMASLVANTAGGTTDTFGAMSAGSSKYKTGSHVDVDGWGVIVGAGKTKEWKDGSATTYGLFFEYGKGDFDTYNGNVHGDGNSENKGIGLMMRHKFNNNTYYEGNIRYGKQETEWGQSDIGSYDTDSRYYGISVGVGHIYPVGKNEIDVYGRYTYGHVAACDATVGTSEYHFDSVKSHRVRVGGKYNFKQKNSNAKPYIGLAWEHEFKGEAKASISGVGEAPAPSMKGNTGILEVGCDWNVSKKWIVGLGANAYMGKRKGWDGMARVFYNF